MEEWRDDGDRMGWGVEELGVVVYDLWFGVVMDNR